MIGNGSETEMSVCERRGDGEVEEGRGGREGGRRMGGWEGGRVGGWEGGRVGGWDVGMVGVSERASERGREVGR